MTILSPDKIQVVDGKSPDDTLPAQNAIEPSEPLQAFAQLITTNQEANTAEQLQEQLLLEQILNTAKGGLHSALPPHFSKIKGGFESVLDDDYNGSLRIDSDLISEMKKNNACEGVLIKPMVDFVYAQELVSHAKKGFFRTTQAVYKTVIKGERAIPFSEFDPKWNNDDPAYEIIYTFQVSDYTITYKEYEGRPGQIILCKFVLPESIIKSINPENIEFFRKLVAQYYKKILTPIINKSNQKHNTAYTFEGLWEKGEGNGNGIGQELFPLKPPYNEIDEKGTTPVILRR